MQRLVLRGFLEALGNVDLAVRVFRDFKGQGCCMSSVAYCIRGGTFDQSPGVFADPRTAFDQTVVVSFFQLRVLDCSACIDDCNPDGTMEWCHGSISVRG